MGLKGALRELLEKYKIYIQQESVNKYRDEIVGVDLRHMSYRVNSTLPESQNEEEHVKAFLNVMKRTLLCFQNKFGWKVVVVCDPEKQNPAKAKENEHRQHEREKQKERLEIAKQELQECEQKCLEFKDAVHIQETIQKRYEVQRRERQSRPLTKNMMTRLEAMIKSLDIVYICAPDEMEADHVLAAIPNCAAIVTKDEDLLLYKHVKEIIIEHSIDKDVVEVLSPARILQGLGLSLAQLLDLCILTGTDYNPGGVKNIGATLGYAVMRICANLEEFEAIVQDTRALLAKDKDAVPFFYTMTHYDRFPQHGDTFYKAVIVACKTLPDNFLEMIKMVRHEFERAPSAEFMNQYF